MLNNTLMDARLALNIFREIFMSTASNAERVVTFADIIKAQSSEAGTSWKTLLRQYRNLSVEIYKNQKFGSDKLDFFKQTYNYINSRKP